MQVLQTDTVLSYIARLREDPLQVELLFRELLIGVTQFFRDPDAFDALSTAIEKILEREGAGEEVRIWVPACATGEEAYSIAILMKEAMEKQGVAFRVQIFATDIDDNAVSFARSGRYRKTTGISPERLARWFTSEDEEVRPIREIREMCVFSVHSVVKDPPFSRLDLLSCRNLLIYMDADLQDRVLACFITPSNPMAFFFLGRLRASVVAPNFSRLLTRSTIFFSARKPVPHFRTWLSRAARGLSLCTTMERPRFRQGAIGLTKVRGAYWRNILPLMW
jgi:two-component system CheB/CheR fusion protein